MGKSLTETAKAVLMKEDQQGIPSVSPMDAGHPDRDAKKSNPNMATLKPNSKYADGRHANPPGSGDNVPARWTPPDGQKSHTEIDAVTEPDDKRNLGALASKDVGKDTSKSSQSTAPVKDEPMKKLEEDIEISEELEQFISTLAEQGYSEEQIAQAIEENFELVEETEEEDSDKKDKKEKDEEEDEEEEESGKKNKKKEEEEEGEEEEEESGKKHMKEHIDALLAGENLSEDFRSKAETIFESAVSVRVNEELSVLEEAYAKSLEEEVEKIKTQLTEQVDDYLNYVVEQWISENEVAIETGLRTEITEDFISGLRNLFAEHYIDIPEDKVSVIEELGSKIESLEAKLNEEIDRNVSLTKQVNESKQFEILTTACEGLTTTQAEKLKALAGSVGYTDANEYAQKIHTLKESYFSTKVKAENVLDSVESNPGMISEETTGRMSAYVKALGSKLPT